MKKLGRRNFLKSSAAGITVLNSASAFAAKKAAVRLGVIGCGGRGIHVALGFMDNTSTQVIAIADVFDDRLAEGKTKFDEKLTEKGYPTLKKDAILKGPDAYIRMVERSDVDAVLIASPHFVHPEQLEAAVDAGKHVYLEKPVAVDVRGCRKVMQAGRKAEGHVSLAVGFQIRRATPFAGLRERIQRGDIGEIQMAQTYYFAGAPKRNAPSAASAEEKYVRLWGLYRALSGDNILLQGIHALDTTNWIFGAHPLKANGVCERKNRDDVGDNMSCFLVHYEYPGNVPVSFQSQQFNPGYGDVAEKFFGTKGFAEAHYSGGVFIEGENKWDSGATRGSQELTDKQWATGQFRSALDDADPNKQKAFIDSIISGNYLNQAQQGAESTLTALLGTTAGYHREEITWDELLASGEAWDPMVDWSKIR